MHTSKELQCKKLVMFWRITWQILKCTLGVIQNRQTLVCWLDAKFEMLADLPECSWSSCWKCGPWLQCRSWPGWGWTPPLLRLVTEQPRCDCGSLGFSAMGLRGWRHTAHLHGCIALLGSTAPVAPHTVNPNSGVRTCAQFFFKNCTNFRLQIYNILPNVQSFVFPRKNRLFLSLVEFTGRHETLHS